MGSGMSYRSREGSMRGRARLILRYRGIERNSTRTSVFHVPCDGISFGPKPTHMETFMKRWFILAGVLTLSIVVASVQAGDDKPATGKRPGGKGKGGDKIEAVFKKMDAN